MYKKVLILVISIIFVLTGCTRIDNDLDNIVYNVLDNEKAANTVSNMYKLFLPVGVIQQKDNEFNQVFKIKNTNVYLYVDTISYYYKNKLNYPMDNQYNYYYKELNKNDKVGYIGINKIDDNTYFTIIVYNYSKIEFYSELDDLPLFLADALIIQDSLVYNDVLLDKEYKSNYKNGKEIKYELDKPKDSESTFSKYLQEYVAEEDIEVKLPDGD